ncbi:transcriptional regulatory protein QseB [Sulfurihydrogenibium azorense Az-Fu1]|uniref:Transcriptional regulatory protein QseB n=1 Tax=Sulfurihydrogenibium azorense (strain DSM 15241 / OCM 825 / Az-Fu1) TaxID=204536 RepID=C1DT32_SULAA|nr:response regulator transcription factor [Sulfurihydrogenibium azorense]ACN98717.1 transcriptional regulatory protein QseB [Sulfurihydrogenibium azorense Az-Fu1]
MRVLLVEDDLVLGESLKEYLEENQVEVVWISDDRKLDEALQMNEYDVIVLDLILKYEKGESILKGLRDKGVKTPVIIITAKNKIEDKETCFNFGADDYLTKPFNPKELLLRIKALSKRVHIPNKYKIKDVEIDLENQIVLKEGKEVKLSKTGWNLLALLLKRKGQVVSTEIILNYVWPDKAVGDEIVRQYIKELRKILPPDSIETHKGIGYRLKDEV